MYYTVVSFEYWRTDSLQIADFRRNM